MVLLEREIMVALVANHRDLLAVVERRVGNAAVADEILQDAFVRSRDRLDSARETAVGWLYRVLRNAIIARDAQLGQDRDDELHRVVCKCVTQLADTLQPEYAIALRRIEIDGISVTDFAHEVGISSATAGVQIARAREALRKQVARSCDTCATHGCLDCTCGRPGDHGFGDY